MATPLPSRKRRRIGLWASREAKSSEKGAKSTKPATECSCESYDLYMLGLIGSYGREEGCETNDFQRCDFAGKRWSKVEDLLHESTRSAFAVATLKGKIWILGGCAPRSGSVELEYFTNVFSFDLSSKKWDKEKSMKKPRAHLCAAVVGNSLYAIGGKCQPTIRGARSSPGMKRSVEEFKEGERLACASMLNPRFSFASCVVGKRIYVAGGESFIGTTSRITERTEIYSTSEDQWTSMKDMPTPRQLFGMVMVNNRIYAVGGDEAGSVISIDSTFVHNKWSISPARLPIEFSSYDVFAHGGNIYVLGAARDAAGFLKLRLADHAWEHLDDLPSSPWRGNAMRVALIKNRPCENERRLRSTQSTD